MGHPRVRSGVLVHVCKEGDLSANGRTNGDGREELEDPIIPLSVTDSRHISFYSQRGQRWELVGLWDNNILPSSWEETEIEPSALQVDTALKLSYYL